MYYIPKQRETKQTNSVLNILIIFIPNCTYFAEKPLNNN